MKQVDIGQLLHRKQTLLRAKLGLSDVVDHPTARGDIKEYNWLDLFQDFFPNRYRISRGAFIIDSRGRQSSEIDLVVHDNYFHPELFSEGQRRLIPAESVYAVLEIKPELTKRNIEYAVEKAKQVRSLHRTNGRVVHAGGVIEKEQTREPLWITAGILTSSCGWREPFGRSLTRALDQAPELGRLDVGYCVEQGAFEASYGETGVEIDSSVPENGLLFFLTRTFARIQGAGSVPVIDLTEYVAGC